MRGKPVPQRTCVVCRQKQNKRSLLRLVMDGDQLMVDPSGKRNGRGAYVCQSANCRQQAVDTMVLNQALRVSLTTQQRASLHEQFQRYPQ